ncbi:hypothetical protein A2U01_0074802, partial [Trifolium medium]|nr:hypothetical protein [Trifolium medium]
SESPISYFLPDLNGDHPGYVLFAVAILMKSRSDCSNPLPQRYDYVLDDGEDVFR